MKANYIQSQETQDRELYDKVLAAGRKLSYPYFLGSLGVLGRFSFCSLDCLCAERKHAPANRYGNLIRLGLSVEPVTGTVQRSNRSVERKMFRDARSLADIVANVRAPAVPYLCKRSADPVWLVRGHRAVAAMGAQMLLVSNVPTRIVNAHIHSCILQCKVVAEFLLELRGSLRTAYGNRLKRAAEILDELLFDYSEANLFMADRQKNQRANASYLSAGSLLADTGNCLEGAADFILEATCLASNLSRDVCDALYLQGRETLSGTQVKDMVYMARAGSTPFRQLAAESLSKSDQPQAVSSLRQLIYDSEENVALVAAQAFKTVRPDTWPGSFLRSISDMAGEPSEFKETVVAGLLLHLKDAGDVDKEQLEVTLQSVSEAWPKSKLIRSCAAGLVTGDIQSE